ncbi:MAG TPA: hypothetical protein VGM03_16190 [Phycisphaerae bacterium]
MLTEQKVRAASAPARRTSAVAPAPALVEQSSGAIDSRVARAVELAAAFVVGCLVMRYFYGDHSGVPEFDSYYHIKMGLLLPKIGFIKQFPWLSQTIFADHFISHHWGFQALLTPFVYIAQWVGSDPFMGAKWAMCVFFGVGLLLFTLLLQQENVPLRWMWILIYLVGPEQYFDRHTYIRAINPSAACMLAIMILMFRGRYVLMGLAIAIYTQIYLGSVVYTPFIVGLYFLAGLVGPKESRLISWKLPVFGAAGWFLGFLLHPYRDGMFDFLRVQLFETGLTPVIGEVGTEWNPYDGVWWFAVHGGVTLVTIALSLSLRLRFGPPINAKELGALLISFFFLILVMRTRRFIESWPLFSLVASAMLAAPVLRRLLLWMDPPDEATEAGEPADVRQLVEAKLLGAAIMVPLCALGALWYYRAHTARVSGMSDYEAWLPLWIVVTLLLMAAPLVRIWSPAPAGAASRRVRSGPLVPGLESLAVLIFAAALFLLLPGIVVPNVYAGVRDTTRANFNLEEMKKAMNYLQANSREGSIVFTDDWDIFPAYFYYNHHNHYIVGLDPVFSYKRDPEMWARYVFISRGQIPKKDTIEVPVPAPPAPGLFGRLRSLIFPEHLTERRSINVTLADVPQRFHCTYAITDRDHIAFRTALDNDPMFERIYPPGAIDKIDSPEFVIHKVRSGAAANAPAARSTTSGPTGAVPPSSRRGATSTPTTSQAAAHPDGAAP